MRMPISLVPARAIKILIVFIGLAAVFSPHTVSAKIYHYKHRTNHHARSLVDNSAGYADIVIDAESGRILHATNADNLRHPASLTKMMTLYLTFQALESGKLELNQILPVTDNAAEQAPSKLGLRPGESIRVEDAILGVVTESANDAAVVLAEALGGSESRFAQMMTQEAHALGMKNTHYHNASGLPGPDQVTTARDMAILGHALIYHYAQFYPYFSHDSFTYAGIYHHNHNHLMDRYDGMDGIKTGYIRASGFNLVASAVRGPVRLVGVVFGGHSTTARDNQMALLLDQAFEQARDERLSRRMVSNTANYNFPQGDGGNADEQSEYVALPAKSAAIFPSKDDVIPVSATGTWGIQIGAYSDPDIGRQVLENLVQTLPQWLSQADQTVEKISAGGGTIYRARLVGLDLQTAHSACNYLVRHRQNCLIITPG